MKKEISPIATQIIERLAESGNWSMRALDKLKRAISKQTGKQLATNTDLIAAYSAMVKQGSTPQNDEIEDLLTVKPMRSESGVAIVTVLTMPFPCPGQCIYCPDEERMPKSYIASEPAATRALALQFDPYTQVRRRIEMLEGNGHPADKIELIIKGGTWSSYPVDYQQWFVAECYKAMNETGGNLHEAAETDPLHPYSRFHGSEKSTWDIKKLFTQQKTNETSLHRCIGLTIETRPDYISIQEVKRLRDLGCTRVELGVQTTDDTILALIKRGHSSAHAAKATKLLKDAGCKVDYHLMPGLPGATPEIDMKSAHDICTDQRFCPDMIKLYPTVVTPNTELETWWKGGRYTPYATDALVRLLAEMKTLVPPWMRISRIIRDIPAHETVAGNQQTNLRQVVQEYMSIHGMRCRCLRCREISHRKDLRFKIQDLRIEFIKRSYDASDGMEYFLSFEDKDSDTVFAFLRMRFPSQDSSIITKHIPELGGASIIRELHTYGQMLAIGDRNDAAAQHKGYGRLLVEQAEKLAREGGYTKMAVISGIGVREYYRKLGYSLEGTYMIKYLS